MSYMYMGVKKPSSKNKSIGSKPFLRVTRPSKLPKGVDGSLDPNLMFQYCKDTSQELEKSMETANYP